MPATANGGARAEAAAAAPSCTGVRPEDLAASLSAEREGRGSMSGCSRALKSGARSPGTEPRSSSSSGAPPTALVQSASDHDGARAVLAAGVVGLLTRLLAHPAEKEYQHVTAAGIAGTGKKLNCSQQVLPSREITMSSAFFWGILK